MSSLQVSECHEIRGQVWNVEWPSGGLPFEILVCPLSDRSTFLTSGSPAVVVFVNDPENAPRHAVEVWRVVHGFTETESAVAARAVNGEDVETVAASLGISVNTVKTHLKSIFGKTDTHRQSELIRRLGHSVSGLAR